MKCPHCLVEVHVEGECLPITKDRDGEWVVEVYICPNSKCKRSFIYLINSEKVNLTDGSHTYLTGIKQKILIRPKGINRSPISNDVPTIFLQDYIEACLVLPDSPKASAALSRRCLQNILREKAMVKHSDLANEIQETLDRNLFPSYIADIIDAVRNVGNFAAHPIKSKQTGEIIEVEPGEAELNLDVIEALFDFYFVQPALIAKKREEINQKLKEAGKTPMK
jgi:hypothetical protein